MLVPLLKWKPAMALHTWWWFLATVFVLCGTPGPNMLHILGRSVGLGFRGSVPAMAGCLLAMLLVLAASAAGLSALLHSSPMLFEVLRYLGVAYLAWLGIKAWRDSCRPAPAGDRCCRGHAAPAHGAGTVFRGGLWVGLSNPKLLLFAAAFLPQFVDPSRGQARAVQRAGGDLRGLRTVLVRDVRRRWPRPAPLAWQSRSRGAGSSGWWAACSWPSRWRCCASARADSRRARGLFTIAASAAA
jgi:threonine/homoserine/homoserine lactone efflux protein